MTKNYYPLLFSLIILLFTQPTAAFGNDHGSDNERFDTYTDLITADLLRKHLEIIASDSLMGRGTGQRGIEMAADYLAYYLDKAGLAPVGDDNTYFQHFDLKANALNSITYTLSHNADNDDKAVVWQGKAQRGQPTGFYNIFGGEQDVEADIVFAGFGLTDAASGIDHLADVDAAGKWVLVFRDVPESTENLPDDFDDLMQNRIMSLLFQARARGVLVIDHFVQSEFDDEATRLSQLIGKPTGIRLPDRGGRMGFAVAVKSISPEIAMHLLGAGTPDELKDMQTAIGHDLTGFKGYELPYNLTSTTDRDEITLPSYNVLGFIEGCHDELKEEVVVLSAHYDHMGIGSPDESGDMIYNGADDNGSGTVTTLALAQVMKEAKNNGDCLDRSLLFLFVTAEEHGLLGSRYYSDNPVFPIENTITNFNLDMFGRIDYEYEGTDEDYIYIIGAEIISSSLDSLLHVANERSVNLTLDMRYNDLDDRNQFYRRSDHWNFGRLGVPFIFFFSGVHDDYHQPSDTIDKIPFVLLEKRARLIFTTLVEVANAPDRPVVDNQQFINRTQ